MKWFKRISIGILIFIVFILLAGFAYEQISRNMALKKYPPHGSMIDVGGYKLHADARGKGGPVVVFESGLDGGGSLAWSKVQDEVAEFATAFSYDRAGILYSERGPQPKTGEAMAEELHTLLKKSGLKGPYILVGHSMAGIILRSFIKNHPQEVAGIVFVDTSHPEQLTRFPELAKAMEALPPDAMVKLASNLGLVRLMIKENYPSTLPADPTNIINNALFPSSLSAVLEEKNEFAPMSLIARDINSFGNIPLTVITGTSPNRINDFPDPEMGKKFIPAWLGLQKEQVVLSTKGTHVLAPKSGHYVQFDQPELVINAIRKMIRKPS
jgi:pimeloyl-ACP methyl ester carboxylesterase